MSRIATAQEFMCNEYETEMEKIVAEPEHIRWMMIEFAKLHVEAALKAAKVECRETFEGTSYLEERIGNCYPLNNIV